MNNINWNLSFLNGMGQFGTKFHIEGDVPHQTFFVSQNLMHWPKNAGRSFFHFVTVHIFDGQMDGRLWHGQDRPT